MQKALAIPAGISIAVLIALYSKLGANPLRDALTMATLVIPMAVYPSSLLGIYLTIKKEEKIKTKIGFGFIHVAGLLVSSFFVYTWCNFGIPTAG